MTEILAIAKMPSPTFLKAVNISFAKEIFHIKINKKHVYYAIDVSGNVLYFTVSNKLFKENDLVLPNKPTVAKFSQVHDIDEIWFVETKGKSLKKILEAILTVS